MRTEKSVPGIARRITIAIAAIIASFLGGLASRGQTTNLVGVYDLSILQAHSEFTTPVLASGEQYFFKVSGRWGAGPLDRGESMADAGWSACRGTDSNWGPLDVNRYPTSPFKIDGVPIGRPTPDEYRTDHVYVYSLTPQDLAITVSFDDDPIWDNVGGPIHVELYKVEATTPAVPGGSIAFNGATSYGTIASGSYLGGATVSSFTIEFWLKAGRVDACQTLFGKTEFWKEWSIGMGTSGEVGFFHAWPNIYYPVTSPNGVIRAGQWQHVAVVGQGKVGSIYVDGVLVTQAESLRGEISFNCVATGSAVAPMTFGFRDNTTLPDDCWFLGELADIRIWDIALTAPQIAALQTADPATNAPGLRHWIPFDEGSGSTFSDIVGGLQGQVFNTAWTMPSPRTVRVPQDYGTIQAAVNAAAVGDTILISDGTYNEHNIVVAKSLTIASMNGPAATVIDNQQSGRGFIISGDPTDITLSGLTIQNARIPYYEGGGAVQLLSGKCLVTNCIVQGVTGPADYSGGPISNQTTNVLNLVVEDSIVRNNFAANCAGIGGSVVLRCQIYGNTGGNNAMALAGCNATNCTVYGNGGGYLSNPWTVGGGSGGNWHNCIVWNNLPSHNDQQIFEPISVNYCIVQGGFAGTGNLSADPLFVDAANGDFRLQTNSPAIDAGDPAPQHNDPDGTRADVGALYFDQSGSGEPPVEPAHGFAFGFVGGLGSGGGSANWADIDDDGDDDLFIGGYNGSSRLLRNDGGGNLVDITGGGALALNLTQGPCFGDYDNDGLEDLMVTHWDWKSHYLFHQEDSGAMTVVSGIPAPDHAGQPVGPVNWVDWDNDGNLDFLITCGASPHLLYRGNGSGGFTRETKPAFLAFTGGFGGGPGSWPIDVDGDRDTDLIIQTVQPGLALYLNDGDFAFHLNTDDGITGQPSGPMLSWADFDNDGYLDAFTSDVASNFVVYYNLGEGRFAKTIMPALTVSDTSLWRSSTAADFDNDGDVDVLVSLFRETQPLVALLENLGNRQWALIQEMACANGSLDIHGHSDYDGDGDVDAVITRPWNGATEILENQGNTNKWLKIKCVGVQSNRSAIGTTVRLKARIAGEDRWQMRQLTARSGSRGHDSRILHFGLGNAAEADVIRIEWPSGISQEIYKPAANQLLRVVETNTTWLTNGLVAYYPFNGNANDESGNGHHGTLHGGIEFVSGSPHGTACKFNGTDSTVALGNWFNFFPFTIGLWVKPSNKPWQVIMDNNHSGLNNWVVQSFGDGNCFGWFNSTCDTVATNQWSHLIIRYEGGSGHCSTFLNGVLVEDGTQIRNYNNGPNLTLGNWWHADRAYQGELDEIRMYNRALSDDEIEQLYAFESTQPPLAPQITVQPESQVVQEGTNVNLSVTVTGTPPFSYQWSKDALVLQGATNATLTITNVQPRDIGYYSVVVTNVAGSVTSSNAMVSIEGLPFELWQGLVAYYPFNGNANDESGNGNNASSVGAALGPDRFGNDARAYRFTGSGQYISSDSTAVLPLGVKDFSASFWLRLSSYASDSQIILNNHRLDAFQIGLNPFSGSGASLAFVTGPQTEPLDVVTPSLDWSLDRWYNVQVTRTGNDVRIYRDGVLAVQGFTTQGNGAAPTENGMVLGYQISWSRHQLLGGLDDLRVYDRALSEAEVQQLYSLELPPLAPQITVQPESQVVQEGTNVTLSVTVTGRPPFSYQWSKDGIALQGATNSTLDITNAEPWDIGLYSVVVTNAHGSATSEAARLSIAGINPGLWQGLIAHYPFTGDTLDVSGHGNHGQQTNVAYGKDRFGRENNSGTFNGTNSIVAVPSLATLPYFPVTYSVWFTAEQYIMTDPDAAIQLMVLLGRERECEGREGAICLTTHLPTGHTNQVWYFGGGPSVTTDIIPALGQWNHLVLTIEDEDSAFFYWNGAPALSEVPVPLVEGVEFLFTIGSPSERICGFPNVVNPFTGDNHYPWHGAIDDIRIYNRALSAVDVAALYEEESRPPAEALPAIAQGPEDVSAVVGAVALFSVSVAGAEPFAYQWRKDGSDLPGATNTTLSLANVSASDAGVYSVVVKNAYGETTSGPAKLMVLFLPVIAAQPASQAVLAGGSVEFIVETTGTAPLSFQWRRDGRDIPGATGNKLTLAAVQPWDMGYYSVVVTNSVGSVASEPASLTVEGFEFDVWQGLLAHYTFDGNPNDVSGNEHHGTVTGTGLTYPADRFGVANAALEAAGTGGAIQIPTLAGTGPTTSNAFSMAFWARRNTFGSVLTKFLNGSAAGSDFAVWLSGGAINVTGNGLDYLATGYTPASEWTHFCVSIGSGDKGVKVWADGVLLGENAVTLNGQVSATGMLIGRLNGFPDNPLFGAIDDLRLYGRALTDSDAGKIFSIDSEPAVPLIAVQPTDQTVRLGEPVRFEIAAYSPAAVTCQWHGPAGVMSGQTNSILIWPAAAASDAGPYWAVIENKYGSVTSRVATLTVAIPPSIAQSPASATLLEGNPLALSVTATGSEPLHYQWFKDGAALSGATNPAFGRAEARLEDAGIYFVTVTNAYGSATSSNAVVRVVERTEYRLNVVQGGGGGLVMTDPFLQNYSTNAVVECTALPAGGWTFLDWLGDVEGTNPVVSLTMNADKCIQARFGAELMLLEPVHGTFEVIPQAVLYPAGYPVQFRALPDPGYYFAQWTGSEEAMFNPGYYAIDSAWMVVGAVFLPLGTNEVSLTVWPEGQGDVEFDRLDNRFPMGSTVQLTARPRDGQAFLGWENDAGGIENPLTVVMDRSKLIRARFTSGPRLDAVVCSGPLHDGSALLLLTGEWGRVYQIEASTNMVDWAVLAVLTNTWGTTQFRDPTALDSAPRFYRAQEVIAVPAGMALIPAGGFSMGSSQ